MKTSKFISVPDEGYPEIPNLIYYRSSENGIYFDAIYYLKQSGLMGQRNVDDFFKQFSFPIDHMCYFMGLDKESVVLIDEETGNTMISETLEFLFVCYVDAWYCRYVYERLRELHSFGFTVSDSHLAGFYAQRFQNE